MIQTSLLFLSIIFVCIACKGQNTNLERDYSSLTKIMPIQGDTVTSLSNNIMVVYQDWKNNYWFGSWVDGLYKYDGKTLLHITSLNGISFNRIEEIKEDSFGNLYINTNKGIARIMEHSSEFLQESSINDSNWHSKPTDLFFKNTQGSGHVYRYDGKFLHSLRFPLITVNGSTIQSSFSNKSQLVDPYGVYTIFTDSKGHVWFGTAIVGVCYFDGNNLRWIHEDDVTELHNGPSNGVRSILEDQDGYFWFNSLFKYKNTSTISLNNSKWYERKKNIGSLDGKKNGEIFEYLSSLIDKDSTIWIVTYETGIWIFDGKNSKNYLIKKEGKTIHLFSIYSDKMGKLWVATHENGVYTYDGEDFLPFLQ